MIFNSLRANTLKWLNTVKQFVGNLPANCLSAFDYFVEMALKELKCDGVVLRIMTSHSFTGSLNFFDAIQLFKLSWPYGLVGEVTVLNVRSW